jgi:hypothetical protein
MKVGEKESGAMVVKGGIGSGKSTLITSEQAPERQFLDKEILLQIAGKSRILAMNSCDSWRAVIKKGGRTTAYLSKPHFLGFLCIVRMRDASDCRNPKRAPPEV